jgi:hypothetical protein
MESIGFFYFLLPGNTGVQTHTENNAPLFSLYIHYPGRWIWKPAHTSYVLILFSTLVIIDL